MPSSVWAPFSRHAHYRTPSSGDERSLGAVSVCQLDSWVTGVKCGSEAEADWTIWVGASRTKRFTPPLWALGLLSLHFERLNQVSRRGCTSLRTGLWRLPRSAGDIPGIPGLTAWVATGPRAVGTRQTLGHFERQRRWRFLFLPPFLSHGKLSHEQDYNLGFSLDSSLKPNGFPRIQPHAVDKTKRPPSACKNWFNNCSGCFDTSHSSVFPTST